MPLFEKSKTGVDFKKRIYIYKLESSEIYLSVYFDHPGQNAVYFMHNFHTGDLREGSFTKLRKQIL